MSSDRSSFLQRVCVITALALGAVGAVIVATGPADHPAAAVAALITSSALAVLASHLGQSAGPTGTLPLRPTFTGRSRPADAFCTAPVSPFLDAHGALPSLTTAEICAAWQHSNTVLARLQVSGTVHAQARVLATRRQYLEELELRNPSGFAAWLHPGTWWVSDPAPYVLVQRGHTLNPIRASTAFMRGALRGRGPPTDEPSQNRQQ